MTSGDGNLISTFNYDLGSRQWWLPIDSEFYSAYVDQPDEVENVLVSDSSRTTSQAN